MNDDLAPPPARPAAKRALGISLAAHVLVIGALATLDIDSEVSPAAQVTQIALIHGGDGAATATLPPPAVITPLPATAITPAQPPAPATTPSLPPPAVADAPAVAAIDNAALAGPGMSLEMEFIDDVRLAYRSEMRGWISKRLWYSEEARTVPAGSWPVFVEFSIDRDGNLLRARVRKSSGQVAIDESALETLRRAAPLPDIPDVLPYSEMELELRLDFVVPPA